MTDVDNQPVDDDIDALLAGEDMSSNTDAQDDSDIFKSEESKTTKTTETTETETKTPDDNLPNLTGGSFPTEYTGMVNRIKVQYSLLPHLDHYAIYEELKDLSIKSCPTPTLQVLSDELYKVQAAKDRLAEIYVNVIKCHSLKKRAVDIIQDAWNKFTEEKSADRRKADAIFRVNEFLLDFARTESLLKSCTHILKNLDSLHESLSRRITIWQLQLKIQDVGPSSSPELDIEKTFADNIFSDAPEKNRDPNVGTEPTEQSF